MANIRSLKDYIDARYYNDIYKELAGYIADNPGRLDVYSHKVKHPNEAELADMFVKHVNASDSVGDEILLDAIVEAEISIAETVRRSRETAEAFQMFRIPCVANITSGKFQTFTIGEPVVYSRQAQNKTAILSNTNLVPIIAKDDFDGVANAFLSEFCPDALSTPTPVDIAEVVNRMGITVLKVQLSHNLTVFGKIVFNDCEVDIWNPETHEHNFISVKGGTILIDPNVYFMRNLGSYNNTIIHECIHWYKHRRHYWLKGIYNSEAGTDFAVIKCPVMERPYLHAKNKWSDLDWMEWQANGITPRILMPKNQTRAKIEDLIQKYEAEYGKGKSQRLEMLQNVMQELAAFFNVSVLSAKIRMLDLGYKDAEGVSTYIDDHYIGNYAFDVESKDRNQTYCISLADSMYQYLFNEDFQKTINSGKFVYIDSHHVLNDPKYICCLENGALCLTEYAKLHIHECCLRFDLVLNNDIRADFAKFEDSVMFRDVTVDYSRIPNFNQDKHNMELFNRNEDLERFYYEVAEEMHVAFELEQTFSQFAWRIFRQKKLNRQTFADKTLLSDAYFDRIKNNRLPSNPDVETVMAICIGLDLDGKLGEELLEKAGHKLNNSQLHVIYRKFLYSLKGRSIYQCNEILEAFGFKPLIKRNMQGV